MTRLYANVFETGGRWMQNASRVSRQKVDANSNWGEEEEEDYI